MDVKKINFAGLLLFLSINGYFVGSQENVSIQSAPIWFLAIALNLNTYLNSRKSLKPFFPTTTSLLTTSALIIFLVLSTILGDSPLTERILGSSQRGDGLATYISLIFVFIGVIQLEARSKVRLTHWLIAIGIFQLGIGFLQVFDLKIFNPQDYDGITGTFANTNTAGFFFALLATIALSRTFDRAFPRNMRFFYCLLFVAFTLQAILTKTIQGPVLTLLGILGVLLTIIYTRMQERRFHAGRRLLTVIIILGSLSTFIFIYPKLLGVETFKIRTLYWQAAWNMFLENPILGVGPGSFGTYVSQYRDLNYVMTLGPNLRVDDAHNLYLHLLSTLGTISTMIILLTIFTLLISFSRDSRTTMHNAALPFTAVFLVGSSISYFSSELVLMFLVFLATLSSSKVSKEKPKFLRVYQILAFAVVTSVSISALVAINQLSIPSKLTESEVKVLLTDRSLRCVYRSQVFSKVINAGIGLSDEEIESIYLADVRCLDIGIAIARRDVLENRLGAQTSLSRVAILDPHNPILIGLQALLFDRSGDLNQAKKSIGRANSIYDLARIEDPELRRQFLALYSR